jgi:hypothetical protein
MINQEGQACRKCGTAVVKKTPKNKKKRLKQAYYYEWYLYCPGCDTMYMVDEAKRFNVDRPIGMESTKTSPMTVYLGSPDNQVQASAAADMPVLLSFVLAGRHKFIEQYLPTWRALLLDCGAYSAMTRKINIDGHAYRDWYQKFEHIADAYAGIDDIDGDWKKSWANYNEFGTARGQGEVDTQRLRPNSQGLSCPRLGAPQLHTHCTVGLSRLHKLVARRDGFAGSAVV